MGKNHLLNISGASNHLYRRDLKVNSEHCRCFAAGSEEPEMVKVQIQDVALGTRSHRGSTALFMGRGSILPNPVGGCDVSNSS